MVAYSVRSDLGKSGIFSLIQKKKTAFLITARLKSTRLPKKIMLEVEGKPLIVHMLDFIKNAEYIEKIIICTSSNLQDDPLEEIATQENVWCYRGSEDDVLVRLLEAAQSHGLTCFANITADCPMIDPKLIDRAVMEYQKSDADLVKYDDYGLPFSCYLIKTSALEKVCLKKNETDTEVWLKYFTSNPDLNIHTIDVENEYRHSTLKTSIDYPEDYIFIKHVFAELYQPNSVFSILDIINLVKKRPDIMNINANPEMIRRWKKHQHTVALS